LVKEIEGRRGAGVMAHPISDSIEHNCWFLAAGGLQVMRDELNPVCKVGPLLLSLFSP